MVQGEVEGEEEPSLEEVEPSVEELGAEDGDITALAPLPTVTERARTRVASAMANLADGISGLVKNMRSEQQMMRDWVENPSSAAERERV